MNAQTASGPDLRQRVATGLAVLVTVASAPASAEGRALTAALAEAAVPAEILAQPLALQLRAAACRLLLTRGASWTAENLETPAGAGRR